MSAPIYIVMKIAGGNEILEKKINLSLIEPVLTALADKKGSLITILQKTQDIYGYLPKEAICLISEKTGLHPSANI